MRFVWLVFAVLVAVMVLVLPRLHRGPAAPVAPASASAPGPEGNEPAQVAGTSAFAALREISKPSPAARADSVVAFGLAQRGTPYIYAGTLPETGFDCSGFIMYTFARFGVAVPHSTALLIDVGRPVLRAEAQPGDIVVFTGTVTTSTTPGHAGIVITRRGEVPMRFVHASSSRREPFVKVSQVEGSGYERRFMQVRRVLGPGVGAGQSTALRRQPAVRPATAPVTALPALPVPVNAQVAEAKPLPKVLATKKTMRSTPAKVRDAARPKAARIKVAAVAKRRLAPKKKVVATPPGRAPARKR